MKKYVINVILLLFFSTSIVYAQEFEVTSHNIILYNMNDDSLLYEENSEEKVSIASLTKMMTTIVAIENIKDLDEVVTVTIPDFYGTVGYSEAGFKVGDKATYRDLLYGIMLPSGAEAVNAVVRSVAGTETTFVEMMNQKAHELGLKDTHFANPVGKDDENNYSTAKDVASLLKYALQNETFKTIFTTKYYKVPSNELELRSTLSVYNMLDTSSILGSKSGFTKGAGRCLASISHLNGVDYLLVVIKSDLTQNFNAVMDTLTIYDYYSSNYSYQNILNRNSIIENLPVKLGREKTYVVKVDENVSLYLKNDIAKDVTYKYEGINEITSKVKVGDKLGNVKVYYGEELLYTTDVFLNYELKYYHPVLILCIIGGIIFFLLILKMLFSKKKRRRKRRK